MFLSTIMVEIRTENHSSSQGNDEMIIGAPGAFSWTGSVIRIKDRQGSFKAPPLASRKKRQATGADFGETLVANVTRIELEPNDYLGYSVHSGMFTRDHRRFYISGAPRAAHLNGKVRRFQRAT